MTVQLRDSDGTVRLSGDLLATGGATGDVLTQQADGTYTPASGGGGSQTFAIVQLRTSLDFADPLLTFPVLAPGFTFGGEATLTMPPSPFGNNGVVKVRVHNDGADSFDVAGELVVCSVDGLVYLAQDGQNQTVPALGQLDMDFPNVNVSAGAGLSWNSVDKQIDIASAGVFSAYVVLNAHPTP